MSKCKMSFPLTSSPEDFLTKATNAISGAGGMLNGNTSNGDFHVPTPMGKVAGVYKLDTTMLHIEITDKPMLVGCGMIEGMLRSKLS